MKNRLTIFAALISIFLFATSFISDFDAIPGPDSASATARYGIQGQQAPELNLANWIDGKGKPIDPIQLVDFRGSVIYLYFFQDW